MSDFGILEQIEDGIVERLKRYLPSDFYVSSFPAKPDSFDVANSNGVALVHYSGSRYATVSDLDYAQQTREPKFTVVLRLSGQYGGRAGYPILEKVRTALQNGTPTRGVTPLKIAGDQLTDQRHDQWEWQFDVACTAVAIAHNVAVPRPNIPLNRFQQED